jgi:hypothetical protein
MAVSEISPLLKQAEAAAGSASVPYQAIWSEHGDDENFFWRRGVGRPITIEALEALEDSWLNSGDDDDYGLNSFFIHKYYSSDEKQKLFDSRGDKSLYRWQPGMRGPAAIE